MERIQLRTFRTLLPLLKSGAKIDLILDFTNSTHVHFFNEAEIQFYRFVARLVTRSSSVSCADFRYHLVPKFGENFVNIFIVSPGEITQHFSNLFRG